MDEQRATPVTKLQKAINEVRKGKFVPDRENDELTRALGNPEHPGRTRGTPGSVAWKVGFPSAGGYKTWERKRKVEQTELQKLHARVQAQEEKDSQHHVGATPEATPPSQQRSSVASTENVQQPDFMGPSYPVDFITDSHQCHLMTQWLRLKVKAVIGSMFPPSPGATFHYRSIPQGYAVVMVDEITEGFEELQLDHPTGEGEIPAGSCYAYSVSMAEGAHQASELHGSS